VVFQTNYWWGRHFKQTEAGEDIIIRVVFMHVVKPLVYLFHLVQKSPSAVNSLLDLLSSASCCSSGFKKSLDEGFEFA